MSEAGRVFTPRVVIMLLLVLVVLPLVPILVAWNWGWWEAWAYGVVTLLSFVVSRVLAARRHPDLLAERARMTGHEDAKPWDKVLAPLVALGSVAILLVAGLDARFGWSPAIGLAVRVAGLGLVLAGNVLGSYALIENRFFSGMVRIQRDRGHRVVSGGPYRWVRHPGYLGAVMAYLGLPVLLSSIWALIPAAGLIAILILRTRLEDATLRAELDGYEDYSRHVRHRLLPYVW